MGHDLKKASGRVLLCVTCDVEDSSIESLGQIKQTCERHKAPVTWFVEPRLCREPSALNLLREYCRQGDEVGLHIEWNGSLARGLRNISTEQIREELEDARLLLEPHFELVSFRGGGLCQTTAALEILKNRGFKYDSSVACELDEPTGWYQGHDRILPLSAYYPSQRGYDVVGYEDSGRLDILEIPVTRGSPYPKLWCNMLEPGVSPLGIMKLVFEQYRIRRHFQPLVLMVVIFHSWSPRRSATMTRTLDRFLEYAGGRNTEFETIAKAGEQWKTIWEYQPAAREALLWHRFSSDLRTRSLAALIKLAMFAHNCKQDPAYYPKRLISKCQHGNHNVEHEREDGGRREGSA
jgi:hypothetical protein